MLKKLGVSVFVLLLSLMPVRSVTAATVPTNPTANSFSQGMVSLTFDDGWLSIHDNALPLLKKYSLPSTQYLNSAPILGGFPDYMTFQDVKDFADQGSELAWHTQNHADLTTLTAANLTTELTIPSEFLTGINQPVTAFKNFATPYGAYNDSVITEIKKSYRSHRSTDDGFNGRDFDAYNVKVQNILDATTPAQVAAWVNQAKADGTWLVLVYHIVQADPSTAEDYSVTPANLDAELAQIQQSGIAVKTVDQALDQIAIELGTTPPAKKPGDVNGDNAIDALDLSTVLSNWNKTSATAGQGDLNADGTVDALDLSTVLSNWNK